MKLKFIVVSSALAGLLLSSTLFAEQVEVTDEPENPSLMNPEVLHNKDRAGMRKKFKKHHRKMAEKRHNELDTNGDELVDLSEFLAHSESRFRELDANSDGYVSKQEAREHHRELRKRHRDMRKKMHDKNHKEMQPADDS